MFKFGIPFFVALLICGGSFVTSDAQDIFSRSSDKSKSDATKKADGSETAETKSTIADPSGQPSATKPAANVKPAANAKQAKGTDSDAKFLKGSDGWYSVLSSASNAEFRLPGKPIYKERSFSPIAGRAAVTNHMYQFHKASGELSVIISWLDLHDAPATATKINNALSGAVSGAVANVLGQLNRNDVVKSGSHPGREFDFTFVYGKQKYVSNSQVFLVGSRQYRIDVTALSGKEDAELVKKLFAAFLIK